MSASEAASFQSKTLILIHSKLVVPERPAFVPGVTASGEGLENSLRDQRSGEALEAASR